MSHLLFHPFWPLVRWAVILSIFLILQAEKVPKPAEKVPKPTDKMSKLTEKVSKLTEKATKPRKTNRRVTFDDIEIEKTSKPQTNNSQTIFASNSDHSVFDNNDSHPIFSNSSSHPIFDYSDSHPVFDEVEEERESKSWSNSSFMIFDDEHRYWKEKHFYPQVVCTKLFSLKEELCSIV